MPAARRLFTPNGSHNLFAVRIIQMTSQLYLSGKLQGNPELLRTKKDRLMVKVLLETSLTRETRPGELQTESVTLPITLFSAPAEAAKDLRAGDTVVVGVHLYGTRFESDSGIKYGCQIIADQIFQTQRKESSP
jgi:single-stranded DNA-binding protein